MKRLLLLTFLFFFVLDSQAQGDNSLADVPFKERIFTGGGLGMSFGSYQDFISISPMIGYRFTEKLWGGTSFTYRYTKYKYYTPAIKLIDYGINPFLRYNLFQNIFIQTEYEYLNYEFPLVDGSSTRKAFNSFLAGGGFMQPIGDKAAFYALALYNFSYVEPLPGEYSPYYSPLILRAGVSIGF
jgi:hypothetical protein